MKKIFEYIFLFLFGGFSYGFLEIAFRSYTHWTMILLGGLCFVLVGLINEVFSWNMYYEIQSLIGGVSITALEFIFGLIFNLHFGMEIWDYSEMPLNLMGQICLPFTLLWIILAALIIYLDDYLRFTFFKEEKPRYRTFLKEKR